MKKYSNTMLWKYQAVAWILVSQDACKQKCLPPIIALECSPIIFSIMQRNCYSFKSKQFQCWLARKFCHLSFCKVSFIDSDCWRCSLCAVKYGLWQNHEGFSCWFSLHPLNGIRIPSQTDASSVVVLSKLRYSLRWKLWAFSVHSSVCMCACIYTLAYVYTYTEQIRGTW